MNVTFTAKKNKLFQIYLSYQTYIELEFNENLDTLACQSY